MCYKIKNHRLWANALIPIKLGLHSVCLLLLLFCSLKDPNISIYFQRKESEHSTPNPLGLDAVDDGVHQRREKEVDVAHKYMDHGGEMRAGSVHHCEANGREAEHQNSTHVGDAGLK